MMDPDYTRILDEIKTTLRNNPRGMTIIQLASSLDINRNTMAKYLDVLQIAGNVEPYKVGPAKIYTISNRIPVRAMLDLHDDGIILIDEALRIVSANDAFSYFTGLQRNDILGERIDIWVNYYEDSHRINEAFRIALDGLPSELDISFFGAGRRFYLTAKFIPTTFDDGSRGATMVLTDISEKHRQQEDLRKSEERYRTLVESIQDGLYILQNEKFVYCNSALCKIMKMSREEIIGMDVGDFVVAEDLEWSTAEYYQRLAGIDVPTEFILRVKRGDGETIHVTVNAGVIEYNGHPATVGTMKDLSAQLNAEVSILRSHEALIGVLEDLNAPVYVVDSETHTILYTNDKIKNLLGDVSGRVCWEVFHNESGGPCIQCDREDDEETLVDRTAIDLQACIKDSSLFKGENYRFVSKSIMWKDFRVCRVTIGIPL